MRHSAGIMLCSFVALATIATFLRRGPRRDQSFTHFCPERHPPGGHLSVLCVCMCVCGSQKQAAHAHHDLLC
ncbi:hypothetical protein Y032_0014g2375 [Ancylostoma ceylanicum]|uniref:Uncharacterized protein n=1 Tax=Ancylostoma ceylanicum TaxID=53326 RepID=A0A016VAZ6_9BILA|nr:hypothetical protein Y032_0014g2375 [Ancylostoma ceylanicum]